MAEVQLAD